MCVDCKMYLQGRWVTLDCDEDSVACKLYQRIEIWRTIVEHQGSQVISLIYFSYCSSEEVFSDGYCSVKVQSIDGVKTDVI